METGNTVGSRIKKQDLEEFEILKSIIIRPGMYVGKTRLDYFEHLFTGYYLASRRYLGQNDKVDFLQVKNYNTSCYIPSLLLLTAV